MSGIAGDLCLVVFAGLVGGSLARAAKQPLILGYILAGILIGPYTGGATVTEIENIERLADVGVALLLFSLGLEFSLKDLRPIGKIAFAGTAIQVLLSMGMGVAIGRTMGMEYGPSLWLAAAGVSSSTAVILKTLTSRGFASTLSGRIMLGMSIIQDMTLIPIMILLVNGGDGGIIASFVKPICYTVGFILIMTVLSAKAIPWTLRHVARWNSRELFLLFIVAMGLGVGSITYAVGLSFAFGAFVAGMVLSESDYGHKALSELTSLRDIFGLLFFVSVGMLLDPLYLKENILTVLAVLLAVSFGRGFILSSISWLMGYRRIIPVALFFGMLPISEIAFVLIRTGLDVGGLDKGLYSLILNVVILSMLLGPALSGLTAPLYGAMKKTFPERKIKAINIPPVMQNHIVIAGGGSLSLYVANLLKEKGKAYVVIESQFNVFETIKKQGHPVIYGDPTQENILKAVHITNASEAILTIKDIGTTQATIKAIRELAPSIPMIARGEDEKEIKRLTEMGVSRVVIPQQGAAMEMIRSGDELLSL